MIEVINLTKVYGKMRGVSSLNFKVEKGEVLGFLGPNGAGKSTTMNMITGFIPSTEGTVKICGYDILEAPMEAKSHIGYLPEQPPVCMSLTVQEYLEFVCALKGLDKKNRKELNDIMELVKISDVRNRLIKNLSKGYRQRVGLAQALVGYPEILILDEPTVGLDPMQIIEIRNLIKSFGKEHTIILSSHILPEVSAVCDRVIIINKGKIVSDDTTENLVKRFSPSQKLSITVAGEKGNVMKVFDKISGIRKLELASESDNDLATYITEVEEGLEIRKNISSGLTEAGFTILEIKSVDSSLEDIFLQLVTDEKEVDESVCHI